VSCDSESLTHADAKNAMATQLTIDECRCNKRHGTQ